MFSSRIEVVLLVEERCFDEVVRDIFQHILIINLLKNDNNNVRLVNLANMIKFKSIISLVVHLVELI